MLALIGNNPDALMRFGGGDPERLRSYLTMLAAFLGGQTENTRRSYQTAIKQFFEMFDWTSPEDVTVAHVAAFKRELMSRCKPATVYQRLAAVGSFFNYLCMSPDGKNEPLLRSNPFSKVTRKDVRPTPYARALPFDWDDLEQMIDALPSTPQGARDRAILLFLAFTTRRRTEVANLLVGDLDLKKDPSTYTVRLKGGKIRTFKLPEVCEQAIRAYWIISGRERSLSDDQGVFTEVQGLFTNHDLSTEPLSPRHYNRIFFNAARHAGLELPKGVNVHSLRHMTARDLNEAGVSLQDIQDILGHASPVTTQIYLHRLNGPPESHEDKLLAARPKARELARILERQT